jgi:deoxyribodipyrimidine photo-lyase
MPSSESHTPAHEGVITLTTTIWWIRRDLRLADNPALRAALAHGDQVIPLFILDPYFDRAATAGSKRLAFLYGGLRSLHNDLMARGGRLIVRRGEPLAVLTQLVQETAAGAIFAEADGSPYARRRDAAAAQHLPLTLLEGLTAHPPGAVVKADGTPYTVFTPFSKAWKAFPLRGELAPAPHRVPTPTGIASEPIPDTPELPGSVPFPPGETEAWRRLAAFALARQAPIGQYAADRNRMDLTGTSQLSPYLRFGMLSAARAVDAAQQAQREASNETARRGAETWLNELIWREFYLAILYHFPNVLAEAFQAKLRHIPWDNDTDAFAAWCAGRTGYPVVDAAMRQLEQTGWMHNRARMIVASFLVKDLLIDWRWGERWFMQHLVDGDPAANNGGWQWTAGVGTDAAPYFRIFNPVMQGQKFDPQGDYVRLWVPELARVPVRFIHEPWQMPAAEQRTAGCVPGRDYPLPIVDHHAARQRTLTAYGAGVTANGR